MIGKGDSGENPKCSLSCWQARWLESELRQRIRLPDLTKSAVCEALVAGMHERKVALLMHTFITNYGGGGRPPRARDERAALVFTIAAAQS